MWHKYRRQFVVGFAVLCVTGTGALAWYAYTLAGQIATRLESGWFTPPVDLLSRPRLLVPGDSLSAESLSNLLAGWNGQRREVGQRLAAGDWLWLSQSECQSAQLTSLPAFSACAQILSPTGQLSTLVLDADGHIVEILRHGESEAQSHLELPGTRFAQIQDEAPILRQLIQLGDLPLQCSQAVMAIEDEAFLEHHGISARGIGRAIWRNLQAGRFAQGASTITQQLARNYFLTQEKTLRRKLKEQLLAVLLDALTTKEEILVAYLNTIYMGQRGAFQVRGFGAAAEHYFARRLNDLKLTDCALLAAIINNPGRYNPWKQPEAARRRRDLVLAKMAELHLISAAEAESASTQSLHLAPEKSLNPPPPFFLQTIAQELRHLGINAETGLIVETSLDPALQSRAERELKAHLERLESQYQSLKDRAASGKRLEGAVLLSDPASGEILALVGSRDYRLSQFDHLRLARRPVGSLLKPFVYLAALENEVEINGKKFSALTPLHDEPWTYRYDRQEWSPKNYDGKFRGEVPAFAALALSLNIPTAVLAVDVGPNNLQELLMRLGAGSLKSALPSLALGAVDISPYEIAQVYTNLAAMGQRRNLHTIQRVRNQQGEILWEADRDLSQGETLVRTLAAAQVTSMLMQTFSIGTAQSAGLDPAVTPVAGKTGTTNDYRDAWFVGFSPHALGLVWIGYDDNTPVGLTGAAAALPVWSEILRPKLAQDMADFNWPSQLKARTMSIEELQRTWPSALSGATKAITLRVPDDSPFE